MTPPPPASKTRIDLIDLARGIALFAMASYHFCWDLELFGYLDAGTTSHGWLKIYARSIAASFLFLAGVSMVLAHGKGLRRAAFVKRLGMVAGSAMLITLVTYFATPDGFIFFGILHAMTLFSVIGVLFLRLPALFTLAVGLGALVTPHMVRSDFFNPVWLSWIGLFTIPPRSNDFVPLMPWISAFLIGMAGAKIAIASGLSRRLAAIKTPDHPVANTPRFCGRHSLVFYLVHQLILVSGVWLFSHIMPPAISDPVDNFVTQCEAGCDANNEAEYCARFCSCITRKLLSQNLFTPLNQGKITPRSDKRIQTLVQQCSASSTP